MMDIQQAFLQLQNDFEKLIVSKERGIKKNYSKAYQDLRNKLQKVYDDYEKDGVVDVDEFKKYNRLKKLDAETAALLVKLYIDNKKLIKSTLNEVINTTEKKSFKIFKETGINPIKRKFNPTEVINQEIAGKIWTDRMKHYGDNFVYDVHSIIRQGLERGDTYTTMSKTLKEKFGKDLKRTTTIARTESTRIRSYTTNATMEEVNKQTPLTKTWRTMKDEGVRSSHQTMEGVTVKFDEEFTLPSGATCMYPANSGNPAEDINCRCYLEYKVDKSSDEKLNKIDEVLNDKSENFFDATKEWKQVPQNKVKIVKDLDSYTHKNIEYKVDGKHVVLDYSKHEKEVADVIANKYGRDVKMVPRVQYPLGVSTPDYIIDDEKWDLKTLTKEATENTIFNRVQKSKKQADNFIIDITKSNLKEDTIYKQVKKVFKVNSTKNVNKILIFKEMDILNVFKRK